MSNDLLLREAGLRHVTSIVRERQPRLCGHVARLLRRIPPAGSCLVGFRVSDHTERSPACFVVASGGGLSEGYGRGVRGGPGICLGNGQTEAYLKDMSMTGLASVWAMARRRPI